MKLRIIFITHIHADHHLGLLQILRERQNFAEEEKRKLEPIYLIIPFNLASWIDKYTKLMDDFEFKIIFNQFLDIKSENKITPKEKSIKIAERDSHRDKIVTDISFEKKKKAMSKDETDDGENEYYEDPDLHQSIKKYEEASYFNLKALKEFVAAELGIKTFQTIPVEHCPQAYALNFHHKAGWSLVYSGDTKYSEKFIKECQGATILIHESTFMGDLSNSAAEKNHSTNIEAMQAGVKMNAWRTILTHFSQRYAKGFTVPKQIFKDTDTNLSELNLYQKYNTIVAIDHFRFKFSDLVSLPKISRQINKFVDKFQD